MSGVRKTVAGDVAAAIRQNILSGAHAPGEQLRQDHLAEYYDVSRIPVREALLQLESQGLVDVRPHRGFVVCAMSQDEAQELFYMRRLIEPGLVALNVRENDAAAFDGPARLYDEMNDELTRNGPTAEFGALHWEFHRSLYLNEARRRTVETLDRLYLLSERYIRMHLRSKVTAPRSKKEHGALLKACRSGDAVQAEALVRMHIEKTATDLREAFKSAPASPLAPKER